MTVATRADQNKIGRALDLLHPRGSVFEIRAPNCGYDGTISGVFNDAAVAAKAVAELDNRALAPAIYVTLNPVPPALLARASNRLLKKAKITTGDADIECRSWFFIDVDPRRPAGISATDEEKRSARERASDVRTFLQDVLKWPAPVQNDSGNGFHLLFRINLPNDQTSRITSENALKALDFRFSDERVAIDLKVANAARIIKLPGTVSRKGDDTAERPHRRSEVLELPETLEIVTREQIETLAAMQPPAAAQTASSGSKTDLQAWLAEHALQVDRMKQLNSGTVYVLASCPFSPDHQDGAFVMQYANGALSAGCHHSRCSGKGWRELRLLHEPDAYTKRSKTSRSTDHKKQANNNEDDSKSSQADRLVTLALNAGVKCLRDKQNEAFARVPHGNEITAVYAMRSKAFRSYLGRLMYVEEQKAPNATAVADARNVLEGIALHDPASEITDVALRVADDAGDIVLDLGDDEWRGVRISLNGWHIEPHGAVTFRRSSTTLPLPAPTPGGNLTALRDFVRCDAESWPLLAAWVVAALRPQGPYPILILTGEQGASKTTTARFLRSLLDPSILAVRSEPRDGRDLMIAARHSHVVALDNLSRIPAAIADALCCLATGGGFAARELYSDSEEAAVAVSRPIILTAIEDIATRGDLLDRALIVRLRAIPEDERRTEDELWAAFEAIRPTLVGALCDAGALALRHHDEVRQNVRALSRMADFHLWSLAAESAFAGEVSFEDAYRSSREGAHRLAIEDSILAQPLRSFIAKAEITDGGRSWSGTATELLEALDGQADEEKLRRKEWPRSARGLSGALRRIVPSLRAIGVDIELDLREGHAWKRSIRITLSHENEKRRNEPSAPSATTANPDRTRVLVPSVASGATVGNRRRRRQPSATGAAMPTQNRAADGVPTVDKPPTVGTQSLTPPSFSPIADGADGRTPPLPKLDEDRSRSRANVASQVFHGTEAGVADGREDLVPSLGDEWFETSDEALDADDEVRL